MTSWTTITSSQVGMPVTADLDHPRRSLGIPPSTGSLLQPAPHLEASQDGLPVVYIPVEHADYTRDVD